MNARYNYFIYSMPQNKITSACTEVCLLTFRKKISLLLQNAKPPCRAAHTQFSYSHNYHVWHNKVKKLLVAGQVKYCLMASIKNVIETINKNAYLTFILLINKVWDLGKSAYQSVDMDNFISNFDWTGLVFQLIAVIIAYVVIKNSRREAKELKDELKGEIKSLSDFVKEKDVKDAEEEWIHAVAFWSNAFNQTTQERDNYIREKFPKNEKKIQAYLNIHYKNAPVGLQSLRN